MPFSGTTPLSKILFLSALIGAVLAGLFSFGIYAFATPPTSPYNPGETLDPSCTPGSTNCTVLAQVPYTGATATLDLGSHTLTTTGIGSFGTIIGNGTLKIIEGGTSPSKYTIFQGGDQSADITYTLPVALPASNKVLQSDSSGVLSWVTNGSGAGASTALDNLASVAINAALVPDTAGAYDFGSATLPWADLYFAGTSTTPGTNNYKITGASTSGTRTITFPDASGTVTLLGNTATGSGSVVRATSPTLVTPVLGVATATTINKVTITAPASSATLTIADGKTLTASNTLTFTGTDSSSVNFGAGGTVAYTANDLSVFASTTSAQLAGVISNETGSGALVFGTSPTLTTPTIAKLANLTSNGFVKTSGGDGTLSVDTSTYLTGNQTITLTGVTTGSGATSIATSFGSFSSSTLASAVSDETGSGSLVFKTSPTLVTPNLGVATATTVNKVTITAPASSATLTIADGKTLTASNTLTFTGTDASSVAFGTGGTVAYTANKLSAFASTSSSELAGVISDETGSGALVFGTSPTLTTPTIAKLANLTTNGFVKTSGSDGTLSVDTSTYLTGNQTITLTGAITGSGATSIATSLGTFSSASLAGAVSDETGSGSAVFATSPTLVTPTLGVATATTINKVTITAPATGSTLTIANGKTLTASNTLTFTGTDSSSVNFGAGGTVAYTSNNLSVFASTTSAQLAGVLSDETGTGKLVFGTAPTFASTISVGTASSATGAINLNGTTSGTVTLSTADAAGTWTLKLPTSAGTNNYVLKTDGSGNTSWVAQSGSSMAIGSAVTSGTTGSVLYVDGSSNLAQDNSNFYWDGTNHRLGIGTTAPKTALEVVGDITSKGTSWALHSASADKNWNSVAYGNHIFVAVAGGGDIMTSSDGINWVTQTSPVANQWTTVAYGSGLFVAVANAGDGNRAMTSTDGITWAVHSTPVDTWSSVAYGAGKFVAVSGTGNVMTSPDGATWSNQTAAAANNWEAVAYGNGVFVAVSVTGSGNRVMTSPDGVTWTSQTSAADNSWFGVTYGNGLFVAVSYDGSGNRVMTSPDGVTWTIRTSAANNFWLKVAYGNGLFVAVADTGSGNRVMTSADGITWVTRSSAADSSWSSVAYGNGTFVAVSTGLEGVGSEVMTSGKQETSVFTNNNLFQNGVTVYGIADLGFAGTTGGVLQLEGLSSGYAQLVPAAVAGNVTIALPTTSGTVALTANNLSVFAATTSSQLAGVISDETGSGALVFGTAPTIAGGSITGLTTLAIRDTSAAHDVILAATSSTALTADRTLTINMGNVAHTLAFGTSAGTLTFPTGTKTLVDTTVTTLSSLASIGTVTTGTWNGTVITGTYGGTGVNNGTKTITLGNNLTTSGNFALTLTQTGTTNVTLPTSGTLYGTASASITSSQLATSLSDETGSGAAVFGTAPTFTTSLTTPAVISTASDPADAGIVRLGNAETIAWEANPAGTDLTVTMDANNVFTSSVPINATTGFRIGNAATSGTILGADGTNYVASGVIVDGEGIQRSGTSFISAPLPMVVEGRLTTSSGNAAPASTGGASSTIYYDQYKGDRISLYDSVNSRWKAYKFTSEISLALGTLVPYQGYDVFLYDNSGTLTLETAEWTNATVTISNASPAVVTWNSNGLVSGQSITLTTSGSLPTGLSANTQYWVTTVDSNTFKLSTTKANQAAGTFINTSSAGSGTHTAHSPYSRQTALTTQDGVPVKSGAISRRYLGSFLAISTTQTTDSATQRFVWNMYNRIQRPLTKTESTNTWTYNSTTYHQANASESNEVEIFNGLSASNGVAPDSISVTLMADPSLHGLAGIGANKVNATSSYPGYFGATGNGSVSTNYAEAPAIGYSYYAWVEAVDSGTVTFYGPNSNAALYGNPGLMASWWY